MNKKLLALAAIAAMSVSSISAETKVLVETDFSTMSAYSFWKSDAASDVKIENGALVVGNAEATANFWDLQYMVADNFTVTKDVEYTITAKIKGFKGNLHINFGTWSAAENGGIEVSESTDWQTVTGKIVGKDDTDGTAHLLFQSGDFVGTYQIQSVKVTYEAEGGDTPEQPEQPADVVASWYTGNGATFDGWDNSDRENKVTFDPAAVEDGKPCLKVVSAEALEADTWKAQIGINELSLVEGTTYYLSFDIKGTPADGFVFSMQAPDDGYANRGDFGPFAVADSWNHVVLSAVCNGPKTTQMTCTIGGYVGTLYLTNVVLSTTKPAGVDAVEVAPVVNHWTVYNLMGVKVLDTDNEAAVNELANGIYVINGKKVAICH